MAVGIIYASKPFEFAMYCQKLDEFYFEKYPYESFLYLILPSRTQNKMKTEILFIL